MSNPIKPVSSPEVAATTATEQVDGAEARFEVGSSTATASTEGARQADPLQAAIQEVAADIRAGRVPDAQAASEAVIIRLVNLRFGHLGDAQRQRMLLHLHEVMANDPQFQARIDQLLTVAAAQS